MFTKKKDITQTGSENRLEKSLLPFLTGNYQKINVARLQHLESLNLPIANKRVIDLGAGIGDHTIFYLFKNCFVLPVEGREELVNFIYERFGIEGIKMNFEDEIDRLCKVGAFQIIHCYGLLYHLSNPSQFLSCMSQIGEKLFLETCVSEDFSNDPISLTNEDKFNSTQAISGLGCRPTRRWIINELRNYFPFVYLPLTQPKHEQFPQNWEKPDSRSTINKRAIFIASKNEIKSEKLTTEFISDYNNW